MSKSHLLYQLYVDDSGTKEYAEKPELYSNKGGRSRYFVFGGLLCEVMSARKLSHQITDLKRAYFGPEPVEIKSNWLSFFPKRKDKYIDKYGISDTNLDEFVSEYYKLITTADVTLFAAVVDKVHMQETYPNPYYAPAIAYEILMQRIVQHITQSQSVGVIVDDMDGATPKGNQYRENLKKQHAALLRGGSRLLPKLDFSPLRSKLLFFDSAGSQLLQVADTVAYCVYKQFVLYGLEWERGPVPGNEKHTLPMYDRFDSIAGKFCRSAKGRIQGFGIAKCPMLNRVQWGISDEESVDAAS